MSRPAEHESAGVDQHALEALGARATDHPARRFDDTADVAGRRADADELERETWEVEAFENPQG